MFKQFFDRLVGSVVFNGVGRSSFCLATGTRLIERHIGAQKYPKARQIRTGNKAICLQDSATE